MQGQKNLTFEVFGVQKAVRNHRQHRVCRVRRFGSRTRCDCSLKIHGDQGQVANAFGIHAPLQSFGESSSKFFAALNPNGARYRRFGMGQGHSRRKHCNDHQDQWHGNQADQKGWSQCGLAELAPGNGSEVTHQHLPRRSPEADDRFFGSLELLAIAQLHGRPHRWCCLELQ